MGLSDFNDEVTMTNQQKVKAAVYLHAVLRNIEQLCELDSRARSIVANSDTSVDFHIPGIQPLTLIFDHGSCTATTEPKTKPTISLVFASSKHFNGMIDGKANPIPIKGFTHIKFLTDEFMQITDRLTEFLRPTPEALKDPEFSRISTILTANVAFSALGPIARYDDHGKKNAGRIPDGNILVHVEDGPELTIHAEGGALNLSQGRIRPISALMSFDSIETAQGILSGELDSFACLGKSRLKIRGRIAMIDNLNKLLGQVQTYLA